MIPAKEIKSIANLVDSLEVLVLELENSYNNKDSIKFNKTKKEIIETQKKIALSLR